MSGLYTFSLTCDVLGNSYVIDCLVAQGNIHRSLGRTNLSSEWLHLRAYALPPSLLIRESENTIAVRVLDVWQHGGIYDGPIGLIQKDHYLAWRDRPR